MKILNKSLEDFIKHLKQNSDLQKSASSKVVVESLIPLIEKFTYQINQILSPVTLLFSKKKDEDAPQQSKYQVAEQLTIFCKNFYDYCNQIGDPLFVEADFSLLLNEIFQGLQKIRLAVTQEKNLIIKLISNPLLMAIDSYIGFFCGILLMVKHNLAHSETVRLAKLVEQCMNEKSNAPIEPNTLNELMECLDQCLVKKSVLSYFVFSVNDYQNNRSPNRPFHISNNMYSLEKTAFNLEKIRNGLSTQINKPNELEQFSLNIEELKLRVRNFNSQINSYTLDDGTLLLANTNFCYNFLCSHYSFIILDKLHQKLFNYSPIQLFAENDSPEVKQAVEELLYLIQQAFIHKMGILIGYENSHATHTNYYNLFCLKIIYQVFEEIRTPLIKYYLFFNEKQSPIATFFKEIFAKDFDKASNQSLENFICEHITTTFTLFDNLTDKSIFLEGLPIKFEQKKINEPQANKPHLSLSSQLSAFLFFGPPSGNLEQLSSLSKSSILPNYFLILHDRFIKEQFRQGDRDAQLDEFAKWIRALQQVSINESNQVNQLTIEPDIQRIIITAQYDFKVKKGMSLLDQGLYCEARDKLKAWASQLASTGEGEVTGEFFEACYQAFIEAVKNLQTKKSLTAKEAAYLKVLNFETLIPHSDKNCGQSKLSTA